MLPRPSSVEQCVHFRVLLLVLCACALENLHVFAHAVESAGAMQATDQNIAWGSDHIVAGANPMIPSRGYTRPQQGPY
jgi:hypothetical protein